MPIRDNPFGLGRCILNFKFIMEAPPLIFSAYRELGKTTFAIPALTEYQVLACSDSDIKAICESTEETLSFHAAMTDVSISSQYSLYLLSDLDPALEA